MMRPLPLAPELKRLDPDNAFRDRLEEYRYSLMSLNAARDATEIAVICHRLAGAAGTFGFAELGEVAMTIDDRLRDGRGATAMETKMLIEALERALAPTKSA